MIRQRLTLFKGAASEPARVRAPRATRLRVLHALRRDLSLRRGQAIARSLARKMHRRRTAGCRSVQPRGNQSGRAPVCPHRRAPTVASWWNNNHERESRMPRNAGRDGRQDGGCSRLHRPRCVSKEADKGSMYVPRDVFASSIAYLGLIRSTRRKYELRTSYRCYPSTCEIKCSSLENERSSELDLNVNVKRNILVHVYIEKRL